MAFRAFIGVYPSGSGAATILSVTLSADGSELSTVSSLSEQLSVGLKANLTRLFTTQGAQTNADKVAIIEAALDLVAVEDLKDVPVPLTRLTDGSTVSLVMAAEYARTRPYVYLLIPDLQIDSIGVVYVPTTFVARVDASGVGLNGSPIKTYIDTQDASTLSSAQDYVDALTPDIIGDPTTGITVTAQPGGAMKVSLADTLVVPSTYGSESVSMQLSVNQQGRVTGLIPKTIQIPASQVTGLSSSAVTSLTGTANQVIVTGGTTGSLTLSLPQSIATSSKPQFFGLTTPSAGTGGLSLQSVDGGTISLTGQANKTVSLSANGTGTLNLSGPTIVLDGAPTIRIGTNGNTTSIIIGLSNTATTVAGTLNAPAVTDASADAAAATVKYVKDKVAAVSSTYTLPAASSTTRGGVIVKAGSGLTLGGTNSDELSANVTSVAGRTGTVTLTTSDVSGMSSYLTTSSASATYAPLASPTFTGTPTVPTAAAGTSTTQAASTAFVTAAVSGAAGSNVPYDYFVSIPGALAASSYVMTFKAPRAFTLTATGHQGGANLAPTSDVTVTVYKNTTQIGAITIAATTGAFSASFSAAVTFATNDLLRFQTQANTFGLDGFYVTLAMTSSASTAYDLPIQISGTPLTSTKVVQFRAPRAFSLTTPFVTGGVDTNPTSSVTLYVRKNNSVNPSITITISTAGALSLGAGGAGSLSFAAGDLLTVETPTDVFGVADIYLTLAMTWS